MYREQGFDIKEKYRHYTDEQLDDLFIVELLDLDEAILLMLILINNVCFMVDDLVQNNKSKEIEIK